MTSLLDALEAKVREARDQHDPNAAKAPVVLLWPDLNHQWGEAVERLRDRLPLITLGTFDQERLTGPAYWVRCVVAGEIGGLEGTPVLYLPGVGREDLRAVASCPPEVAPLAELQYRGGWFTHPNGRDWSVRSFLAHDQRGLCLDVARDTATDQALMAALPKLLDEPLRRLERLALLDADYLNELLDPDAIGSMLKWLDDPLGFRERRSEAEWQAFVALARADLRVDPGSDGPITAARRLGSRDGAWANAWSRFTDTPERYPGIKERLRQAKPADDLLAGLDEAWPQSNEEAEERLANDLCALADSPPGAARQAIKGLWQEHQARRSWVWTQLGDSPLVEALEHLERVAEVARAPLSTATVDEAVDDYTERGWQVDEAALRALQCAGDGHRSTVSGALEAIYRPWLQQAATGLQQAIGPQANAGRYQAAPPASDQPGVVTVFVDGLRLDVGRRVAAALDQLQVDLSPSLAALPTVTATSKPSLAPVPEGALEGGAELGAARTSSGAQAGQQVLTSLLAERGVVLFPMGETGDTSKAGWTEVGRIDAIGHASATELVDELDREAGRIAARVRELLAAGWDRVDVVTDHGWLLLLSGLPKIDLSRAAVVKRKGRCARLKPGAKVDVPTVPWHWDPNVPIAVAPGVGCFEAGKQYEHGGVSPQECIVPRLQVRARSGHLVTGGPEITKVKWLGLICRVEVENIAPGATVDLRGEPANPASSVAEEAKDTSPGGRISLIVPDEDLEGESAYLVVVSDDRILAQKTVTIGRNR